MLKKTVFISTLLALVMVSANARGMHHGAAKNNSLGYTSNQTVNNTSTQGIAVANIAVSELTDDQKEKLTFMVEEEKVARDVYAHLYDTYGLRIFANITQAEEQHMSALLALFDKYNLEVPSTIGNTGVFENSELQALYDTLTEKGDLSLSDALEVGVEIEETDIADLENILNAGVPEDFKIVYENLLKGSYNHLNAFNNQLIRLY